jgi:hypothetical protein
METIAFLSLYISISELPEIMAQSKVFNKNAFLRSSQVSRIHARDKTHEQRKPKKKRKNEPAGHRIFVKVLQPRRKCKSCTYIPAPVQKTNANVRTIICYPLSGADYSKPLLPGETSHPTQVSGQEGSSTDEYVFSNGRSISYIQGNNSIIRHPGPGAALATQASQFNGFEHERTREESNTRRNTEQNIRKRLMKPPRYPEYTDYGQRLKSFARWYKQKPDPTTLCNAGFFFTSKDINHIAIE